MLTILVSRLTLFFVQKHSRTFSFQKIYRIKYKKQFKEGREKIKFKKEGENGAGETIGIHIADDPQ